MNTHTEIAAMSPYYTRATITRRDLGRLCDKFHYEGNDEVAFQIASQLLGIDTNSQLQALIKRELSSNTDIVLEASDIFGWPDDNEVGVMTCEQQHELREACMAIGRAERQLTAFDIARDPYEMRFDRTDDAPTPHEQQLIDFMEDRQRDVQKIVDEIMATKPAPKPRVVTVTLTKKQADELTDQGFLKGNKTKGATIDTETAERVSDAVVGATMMLSSVAKGIRAAKADL